MALAHQMGEHRPRRLVALTLVSITVLSHLAVGTGPESGTSRPVAGLAKGPSVPLSTVLAAVAASSHIKELPSNLNPSLEKIVTHPGKYTGLGADGSGCSPNASQTTVGACDFGDRKASRTMALYGDSHAGMWFRALDGIATRQHWKLVILMKHGCPASLVPVATFEGVRVAPCDQWHQYVVGRIKLIKPALLVISQSDRYPRPGGGDYSPQQWQHSLQDTLTTLAMPHTREVVIGNLAVPSTLGPNCLARHVDTIQACSAPPNTKLNQFNQAEKRAAQRNAASYIDVMPWFCGRICSPVIGNDEVYWDDHVTEGYSLFLEGVLAQSLDLPRS